METTVQRDYFLANFCSQNPWKNEDPHSGSHCGKHLVVWYNGTLIELTYSTFRLLQSGANAALQSRSKQICVRVDDPECILPTLSSQKCIISILLGCQFLQDVDLHPRSRHRPATMPPTRPPSRWGPSASTSSARRTALWGASTGRTRRPPRTGSAGPLPHPLAWVLRDRIGIQLDSKR